VGNSTGHLLSGVRIVDFTFQAAGAYAAMLLAGLGAEVIKIESEVRQDPTRGRIRDRPYQHSVFFEDVNLGKHSITVNLKKPEGLEVVRRLIASSQATMDNFRPGVLARLGLDPEMILRDYPHVVSASLSAAGWDGPYARMPGYAGIFNALSGYGGVVGYEDGPPTEMRTSMDMRAGAMFATAVMGALVSARRTGKGARVDFSASEAAAMLAGDSLCEHSMVGVTPARLGNSDRDRAPHGVYPCADGWLFIGVRSDAEWGEFAQLLRADGFDVDPSLEAQQRIEKRLELDEVVTRWLATLGRFDAFHLLQRHGVPAAPAMSAEDMFQDENFLARGFISRANIATTDLTRAVCEVPWLVGGMRPGRTEPPTLGRDTREVMRRVLEMDDEEYEQLSAAGALS